MICYLCGNKTVTRAAGGAAAICAGCRETHVRSVPEVLHRKGGCVGTYTDDDKVTCPKCILQLRYSEAPPRHQLDLDRINKGMLPDIDLDFPEISRCSAFQVSLHHGYPGSMGDRNEVMYPGYARVSIDPADWTVTETKVTNARDIKFPECLGGQHQIDGFVIHRNGHVTLGYVFNPIVLRPRVSPYFLAGHLAIDLDAIEENPEVFVGVVKRYDERTDPDKTPPNGIALQAVPGDLGEEPATPYGPARWISDRGYYATTQGPMSPTALRVWLAKRRSWVQPPYWLAFPHLT